MTDHIQAFIDHLHSEGYEPVAPIRVGTANWPRLMYNGEKRGNASGGYRLIQNPDGSYFANYGSSKDPGGFRSWRSERAREKTYAEMAAEQAARDLQRRSMELREKALHERVGRWIDRVLGKYPVAETHPYLTDKNVMAHGIRVREKKGDLLIPRYAADGKIYGCQRIRQRKPGEKSFKFYVKNARSKGLFYPIGVSAGIPVAVIAEGFATGATIHESTGLPVYIAFDAGNLLEVGRAVRIMHPQARIVLAGDMDQWTFAANKKPKGIEPKEIPGDDLRWQEWRESGLLYNTGEKKALAAAVNLGGAITLFPDFPEYHPAKGTDFNDLAAEKGRDYVKMMFEKALEIPQVTVEEVPAGGFMDPIPDVQTTGGDDSANEAAKGDLGMNFRVLGYNNNNFFYYQFRRSQIVCIPGALHNWQNLMLLDRIGAWEAPYRDAAGKLTANHTQIADFAGDRMREIAARRGVFVPDSSVRGCGAWLDDGRIILHCGDKIYCDGEASNFWSLAGQYTYVSAKRLMRPSMEGLSNAEARRLRTICESVTWENKLSGTLLAGWLVIAPMCGALTYRPHIYITGEAESGKSTVMNRIIKAALGSIALCVDGGTTEPAIRQLMGFDARPLVYDEAEKSGAMDGVLKLVRKASYGSIVAKFNQYATDVRFCACFSAITPPVSDVADLTRISFLVIKKNKKQTAIQDYMDLRAAISELFTEDFPERMLARTLKNLNSLISNIRIFSEAARRNVGSARASEQIGTLLAGAYLLGRTDIVTDEEADRIVSAYKWGEHTAIEQDGDPIRLVQHIAASLIRTRGGFEKSVGELIADITRGDPHEKDAADSLLRSHAIAVKTDRVYFASNHPQLKKLLKGTDWDVNWSRPLADVPGAQKEKIIYFSPGIKTSGVSIPISLFEQEPELPVWDEPIEF